MSKGFKIATVVIGVLLGVLGLRWMFTPLSMGAELDISLGSAVALNAARGDLGGLFIAGAILCLLGVRQAEGRWLQAVALVVGCVAVGRSVGIAADGVAAMSVVSIAVEVAMVATLLAAARQMRSR